MNMLKKKSNFGKLDIAGRKGIQVKGRFYGGRAMPDSAFGVGNYPISRISRSDRPSMEAISR